jgi:hypothetical protein
VPGHTFQEYAGFVSNPDAGCFQPSPFLAGEQWKQISASISYDYHSSQLRVIETYTLTSSLELTVKCKQSFHRQATVTLATKDAAQEPSISVYDLTTNTYSKLPQLPLSASKLYQTLQNSISLSTYVQPHIGYHPSIYVTIKSTAGTTIPTKTSLIVFLPVTQHAFADPNQIRGLIPADPYTSFEAFGEPDLESAVHDPKKARFNAVTVKIGDIERALELHNG